MSRGGSNCPTTTAALGTAKLDASKRHMDKRIHIGYIVQNDSLIGNRDHKLCADLAHRLQAHAMRFHSIPAWPRPPLRAGLGIRGTFIKCAKYRGRILRSWSRTMKNLTKCCL